VSERECMSSDMDVKKRKQVLHPTPATQCCATHPCTAPLKAAAHMTCRVYKEHAFIRSMHS
jgi:hypothetical protein